jgi:hypothetical protein
MLSSSEIDIGSEAEGDSQKFQLGSSVMEGGTMRTNSHTFNAGGIIADLRELGQ